MPESERVLYDRRHIAVRIVLGFYGAGAPPCAPDDRMREMGVRRALHTAHAVATLALLATGVLIEFPELRGLLLGGFGRQVAELHSSAGIAFLAAPALALVVAGRALLGEARRRLVGPVVAVRKAHVGTTLATGVLLAGTGVLLWFDRALSTPVLDATVAIHVVSAWALVGDLVLHLVAVVARRVRVSRPSAAVQSRRAA